ncbi:MAG: YqgE/AlgH family protein [Bacteroidales bacterium]
MNFDVFNISHNAEPPAKGRGLVSVPFISDGFFHKTVIYIVEHSQDQTVGFILNQPLPMSLHEIVEDVPESDFPIHIGGPIDHSRLHMLHTIGSDIPGSVLVSSGIYWGGDFEYVKRLIQTNKITTNQIRFFLGYSGWGNNQLQQEILEDTWIITSIFQQDIFSLDTQNVLWNHVLQRMGDKYKAWTHFPPNPLYN